MASTAVLASGWKVEIGTTEIKGLETITFSSDAKEATWLVKESNGREEHQIASRGNSVKIDGFYIEDATTGTQDAGQVAVETLANEIGVDSLDTFKVTSPDGKVRTFQGSVKMSDLGGKISEMSKWGAEIKVSGAIAVA